MSRKIEEEIPKLRTFNSGDVESVRKALNRRESIDLPSPQSSTISPEEEFPPLTPERERRSSTRSTTRAQYSHPTSRRIKHHLLKRTHLLLHAEISLN
jgi:hypothetical protein